MSAIKKNVLCLKPRSEISNYKIVIYIMFRQSAACDVIQTLVWRILSRLTLSRSAVGRLAGPRTSIFLMRVFNFGSVKVFRIASGNLSLANFPHASAKLCFSRFASTCTQHHSKSSQMEFLQQVLNKAVSQHFLIELLMNQ